MPVSQKPRKRNRSVSPAADERVVKAWYRAGAPVYIPFSRYRAAMIFRRKGLTYGQIRGRITGMGLL